ncbi:hypothetical protein BDV97DRAFT_397073 [Delphinella strobiligena]|nr:hypothetical protein BDV97DRAFT_397073 [Delphinella strobiligena]
MPSPIVPSRETWPGWCEVESEPAFFNTILHDSGVSGIKLQEVLGLDDDALAILPKPVHAMIFLFRYREDARENEATTCPSNVWFANQVPEFACASVALLNIVMNIPNLELGSELQRFKEFTQPLDPVSKGDAIAGFDFIRNIHNSFARNVDMLNVDALLKEKHLKLIKRQKLEAANSTKAAKAAEKAAQKAAIEAAKCTDGNTNGRPARSNPPRKSRASKLEQSPEPSEDEGFHFIAYMPVDDHVWELDGMDRFPESLGKTPEGQDWLAIVQAELMARMLQYQGDHIEFSLMAVIKDPIIAERQQLAENIKALQETNRCLDEVSPMWRGFIAPDVGDMTILGPSEDYSVTEGLLNGASLAPSIAEKLKTGSPDKLMQLRHEIVIAQAGCRAAIRDQMQTDQSDAIKAMHRRFDYASFVNEWLDALADKDVLLDLLARGP